MWDIGTEIERIDREIEAGFRRHGRKLLFPVQDDRQRLDFEVLRKIQFYSQLSAVLGSDGQFEPNAFKELFPGEGESTEHAVELWRQENDRMSEEQAEEHFQQVGLRDWAKKRIVALSFANYADDSGDWEWINGRAAEAESNVLEFYAVERVPFFGGEFVA